MAPHYYSRRAGGGGAKRLISDFIREVGVEFVTLPGVFSPSRIDPGTRLLLEYAVLPENGLILDVGCGYGVIGITVAKAHPALKVYMTDVNLDAVKLARINARRNGVEERVVVLHGDLYDPLPRQVLFDAILSNPPLSAGMKVVKRLVSEAPKHLRPEGTLQLVVWRAHTLVEEVVRKTFGSLEILASKKGYKVILARKP